MRPLLLLATSLLVLTGCGSAGDTAGEQPSGPADTAATAPASEPTTEATTDTAAATELAVVLEPGGLGVSEGSGVIRRLPFDDIDQPAVATAVEAVLGPPTSEEQGLECGPGPLDALSWDGFDVYFLDDTFVGWYLSDPAPAVTATADGIGLGSTLTELEESFADVTVEESTIGIEWAAGELSGTLTGDEPDATVDVLWSGATCIAR